MPVCVCVLKSIYICVHMVFGSFVFVSAEIGWEEEQEGGEGVGGGGGRAVSELWFLGLILVFLPLYVDHQTLFKKDIGF